VEAWLSRVKVGDAIAADGIVGRGFSSRGNFLLFATDALLLYDSVGGAVATDDSGAARGDSSDFSVPAEIKRGDEAALKSIPHGVTLTFGGQYRRERRQIIL
jgi:hypothetical protein